MATKQTESTVPRVLQVAATRGSLEVALEGMEDMETHLGLGVALEDMRVMGAMEGI
jgi:hypothetical protein